MCRIAARVSGRAGGASACSCIVPWQQAGSQLCTRVAAEGGVSEVSSQILPQIETRHFRLSTTCPTPPIPPTKTPRPRRWCFARPKPIGQAQKDPPSRRGRERERQQGNGTSPRRNRPAPALRTPPDTSRRSHWIIGRTRGVEFSEGIGKCRTGDPDCLFASSPATSTTPRARSES